MAWPLQFAKLAGARVISTVSCPEKADIVRKLGADVVVNYRDTDAADQILTATSGQGVDIICETDFAANLYLNAAMVAPQGHFSTFGSDSTHRPPVETPALFAKEAIVRFVYYCVFPISPLTAQFRRLTSSCGPGISDIP